ncbi:MAG: RICIN domain-containing protein [Ruminococcus sp.]|nr:RICIN domain-containing protein [Ruminococcus sp.]
MVDIEGGATGSGANVQMWTKNDTSAQKFQIWGLNKAGTTHVYCNEGTTFTPTTFSWNAAPDTLYYDVKIWKGTVWEGDAYKILWSEQGTSCTVELPEGYYEAYVDCRNKYSTTMSENVVKFTVSHGTPVTLGQSFTANITHHRGDFCVWVTDDENVTLQKKNGGDTQKWIFELQSDDTYKITNVASNKCLDVYNVQSDNGTNIQVWQNHETDAQLFYICQLSNGYALIPKCSLRSAVDITWQEIKDGTNIEEWEFNGSDSQTFSIEYISQTPAETVEFEGHRYEYYHLGTSWDQAYMICEKKGGHLVSVNSNEETNL